MVLAVGVVIATNIVPGIHCSDLGALAVAVILLSFLNAILRPVLLLFTLPFIVLTLGLGIVVINAFLFLIAGRLVNGFRVDGFWPAVGGSLVPQRDQPCTWSWAASCGLGAATEASAPKAAARRRRRDRYLELPVFTSRARCGNAWERLWDLRSHCDRGGPAGYAGAIRAGAARPRKVACHRARAGRQRHVASTGGASRRRPSSRAPNSTKKMKKADAFGSSRPRASWLRLPQGDGALPRRRRPDGQRRRVPLQEEQGRLLRRLGPGERAGDGFHHAGRAQGEVLQGEEHHDSYGMPHAQAGSRGSSSTACGS